MEIERESNGVRQIQVSIGDEIRHISPGFKKHNVILKATDSIVF